MVHRPRVLSRTAHAVVTLLFIANLVVGAKKNDSMASLACGGRLSTLGGMCFESTVSDETVLRDLRRQHVKFNLKKSMYRDGDIIATYKLDRPGHGSLAGCADACLLNWRLTSDTTQALDTDCSLNENSHCPMTSGILVADRKCQAFMFNRITSVCTLLSAERSLKLTQSSKHWSGKLSTTPTSSITAPPPPSPPPPPPSPPPPPPPGTLQYTVVDGYFADNTAYFDQNGITVVDTGQVTSIPNIDVGTDGYFSVNGGSTYSVQWLGYFRAPTTGSYTFYVNSDDASYLWIGSSAMQGYTATNALAKVPGIHPMRKNGGTVSLDQGTVYRLRVQFGENDGGDNMIVSVTPPGGTETTDLAPFLAHQRISRQRAIPVGIPRIDIEFWALGSVLIFATRVEESGSRSGTIAGY
eukprot:jgi/Picre1/35007/NNA_002472.t1